MNATARTGPNYRRGLVLASSLLLLGTLPATDGWAQEPATPAHQHPTETPSLFRPRDASGTAWIPDESPMTGWHAQIGPWQAMVHGSLFGQFLYESGNRHRTGGFNATQVSSVNWGMVMARRPAGAGFFGMRAMLSAEPWTVSNCGFINLLANGEMCRGDTIHDRQHPHDTFMELAAEYDLPLRSGVRLQLYGGLAGEPALGPAGFPHRPSAALNPIAPITHHWLDSTHITFGLVTAAVYGNRWKVEGSVFNSREPDANRTNLEFGLLDSTSARISFTPTPRVVFQVSAGHLHESEAGFPSQPRSDVNRLTASVAYARRIAQRADWNTTAAYGVNGGNEIIPGDVVFLVTHAALVETTFTFEQRHTWFGRLELVGKPGHDLHVHEAPASIFPVGKIEAGYVRQFRSWFALSPGLGGVVTANLVGPALAPRYSGNVAWGLGGFFALQIGERH